MTNSSISGGSRCVVAAPISQPLRIRMVLREINRTHSVVVVEHDMSFVRALGVKVTVLHEGSMLAEGTLDQVSADQRVVEVYLGR